MANSFHSPHIAYHLGNINYQLEINHFILTYQNTISVYLSVQDSISVQDYLYTRVPVQDSTSVQDYLLQISL